MGDSSLESQVELTDRSEMSVTNKARLGLTRAAAMHTTATQRSMYYVKPQRNMDEADKLRGLDEERAAEKSLFFKAFDKYADSFYNFIYKRRPNSAFPRIFAADPFCRLMVVHGIPGSGARQVASDLAVEKGMTLSEQPSLYYFWERYGRNDTPMRNKLTESGENGGIGNWWQDQYRMSWDTVYANPGNWEELCKCLSWQMRSYRLQESDDTVEHLVSMKGLIKARNYFSFRAEIHACGETGRIPADMYQSFIDQWNHMEGRVCQYAAAVYIDIEPEIAYANIQNSDEYTADQKAFYTLDYLKAYKEGYEMFVLPQAEELETLMFKYTPDQITSAYNMGDDMLEQEPEMVHIGSIWHLENWFMDTNSYSGMYLDLLAVHSDLGCNQHLGAGIDTEPEGIFWPAIRDRDHENKKAMSILKWHYPRENIDGFGWEWSNMFTYRYGGVQTGLTGMNDGWYDTMAVSELKYLRTQGDGYHQGQNDGDVQKNGLPQVLNTLFNSTHRQMIGVGARSAPFIDLRGPKTIFKQSV